MSLEEREPIEAGTDQMPDETVEETAIESGDAGDDSALEGESTGGKKVTIDQHEYLQLKVARERQKDIEAENERLRAERGARPTTDMPSPEVLEQKRLVEQKQERLANLRQMAKGGDQAAQVLVDALDESLAAEERTLVRLEMADIPKEERAEVQAFMREKGVKSPAIARQFLRGGDRFETLAEENARLKRELEEMKQPKPKVETTSLRGAARSSVERKANGAETLTVAEYARRMNDPALYEDTKRKRDAGLLTIKA